MKEQIINFLKMQDDIDVIYLWNEHCPEDYIRVFDEENLSMLTQDPIALTKMVYFGNVGSWDDKYFVVNAYGNIDTFNSIKDEKSPIDLDYLATEMLNSGFEL